MTCKYRNTDSDTLIACMGLQPLYTETQVASYADRVGPGGPAYVRWFVLSNLRVNRMIRPNIPEGPCGNFAQPGNTLGVATSAGSAALGIGNAVVNAISATADAVPGGQLIGIAISAVQLIGGFIKSLTGAPSQKELQVDCAVVNAYNQFASAMEQALASGKIQLQDALSQLNAVCGQLDGQLQTLAGYNQVDFAPYSHAKALAALKLFNTEVVYPAMAQGSFGSSGLLWVGGGAVAAKLLGVF